MATLPLSGNVDEPVISFIHKTDHRPANHILQPVGAGTDLTPPTVTIISPANLRLGSPNEKIVLRVEDNNTTFSSIVLLAEYPSGDYEVIHDGVKFATRYVAGSSRIVITQGFEYSLKRAAGWPSSSFKFRGFVVDGSGNLG